MSSHCALGSRYGEHECGLTVHSAVGVEDVDEVSLCARG